MRRHALVGRTAASAKTWLKKELLKICWTYAYGIHTYMESSDFGKNIRYAYGAEHTHIQSILISAAASTQGNVVLDGPTTDDTPLSIIQGLLRTGLTDAVRTGFSPVRSGLTAGLMHVRHTCYLVRAPSTDLYVQLVLVGSGAVSPSRLLSSSCFWRWRRVYNFLSPRKIANHKSQESTETAAANAMQRNCYSIVQFPPTLSIL